MKSLTWIKKAIAVVALAVTAMLLATTAANASVTTGYGHTSTSHNTYTGTWSGTVYDDAADGSCVRAYGKGYNYFLGWGGDTYLGQACGKGDHTGWSQTPRVYGDKYAVSICKGMPNSSRSNCTGWYYA